VGLIGWLSQDLVIDDHDGIRTEYDIVWSWDDSHGFLFRYPDCVFLRNFAVANSLVDIRGTHHEGNSGVSQ
jgi:hypothetical protein